MIIHRHGDVVLFYAEQSLLTQVAAWVRGAGSLSLRLVASPDPLIVARALGDAVVAIIDATPRPGEAMAALERCLRSLSARQTAVYTEQMHHGLELFSRVRGVQLLMGPMSPPEWDAFFEPFESFAVPLGRQEKRVG